KDAIATWVMHDLLPFSARSRAPCPTRERAGPPKLQSCRKAARKRQKPLSARKETETIPIRSAAAEARSALIRSARAVCMAPSPATLEPRKVPAGALNISRGRGGLGSNGGGNFGPRPQVLSPAVVGQRAGLRATGAPGPCVLLTD